MSTHMEVGGVHRGQRSAGGGVGCSSVEHREHRVSEKEGENAKSGVASYVAMR